MLILSNGTSGMENDVLFNGKSSEKGLSFRNFIQSGLSVIQIYVFRIESVTLKEVMLAFLDRIRSLDITYN